MTPHMAFLCNAYPALLDKQRYHHLSQFFQLQPRNTSHVFKLSPWLCPPLSSRFHLPRYHHSPVRLYAWQRRNPRHLLTPAATRTQCNGFPKYPLNFSTPIAEAKHPLDHPRLPKLPLSQRGPRLQMAAKGSITSTDTYQPKTPPNSQNYNHPKNLNPHKEHLLSLKTPFSVQHSPLFQIIADTWPSSPTVRTG